MSLRGWSVKAVIAVLMGGALFTLSAPVALSQDTGSDHYSLIIGKTDPLTTRGEMQLRPLAAYLAQRLGDAGVSKVRTAIPGDPATLADYLRTGKVDIVFDSSYPVMTCLQSAKAGAFLLGSRQGLRTHHGLVFVRRDSGINTLADLRGRVVAFEDQASTVEYFLPKLLMQSKGLSLREIKAPESQAGPDETGYVMAGSHLNIAAWVFYGKADAGVLSSAAWTEQENNPEAYRREFKIIHETAEAPRLIVAARADLDRKLLARISEELLRMHQTPAGTAALMAYDIDYFGELAPDTLGEFERLFARQTGSE